MVGEVLQALEHRWLDLPTLSAQVYQHMTTTSLFSISSNLP
jgi:hypothetical protein